MSGLISATEASLKNGLISSERKKVTDYLSKVQQKLRELESSVKSRPRQHLAATADEDPPSPGSMSQYEAVNSRLELIERKLDLVAELLLGSLDSLSDPGHHQEPPVLRQRSKTGGPLRISLKISDNATRRSFMKNHLDSLLFALQEEYDLLSCELSAVRKKLAMVQSSADQQNLDDQLSFIERKKELKELQITELKALIEHFHSIAVPDKSHHDLWSARQVPVLRSKATGRIKRLPPLPVWR